MLWARFCDSAERKFSQSVCSSRQTDRRGESRCNDKISKSPPDRLRADVPSIVMFWLTLRYYRKYLFIFFFVNWCVPPLALKFSKHFFFKHLTCVISIICTYICVSTMEIRLYFLVYALNIGIGKTGEFVWFRVWEKL